MGAMKANFWLAFVAATTLIIRRGLHAVDVQARDLRRVANDHVARAEGPEPRGNSLVLAALAVAVLFMGVYPLPFTEVMHASVNELLRHVAHAEAMT